MRSLAALDRSIYRAGLSCCPPAFRREYASEMLRDFDEARREASASGDARAFWTWRSSVALDLARTLGSQWLRSGAPALVAVSSLLPLVIASGLANVFHNLRFALPTNTPDAESIGLVLMASLVVLVIAATILFTFWMSHSMRRIPRRGCSRPVR